MEKYFQESQHIKLVLQLIDIRHKLKESDEAMLEFMEYYNIPYIVVMTKSDKLRGNELRKQKAYFKEVLKGAKIIFTSSTKKIGRNELLAVMGHSLQKEQPSQGDVYEETYQPDEDTEL